MTGTNSETQVSRKAAFIVAVLILLMAVSVLIIAHGYSGGSGIFPRFIGWVFLGLIILETGLQLNVLVKRTPPDDIRVDRDDTSGNGRTIVIKEIHGFLWIGFFLFVLYLAGFLVSIPVYMFAFLRISAKRTVKECLIMSAGSTIFVYLIFIVLMDYRLYPGVLFGA